MIIITILSSVCRSLQFVHFSINTYKEKKKMKIRNVVLSKIYTIHGKQAKYERRMTGSSSSCKPKSINWADWHPLKEDFALGNSESPVIGQLSRLFREKARK
jgi:hypothetical protein